jgi:hypothetical protein
MSQELDVQAQAIFRAAWTRWSELQPLTLPASSALVLWQQPNRTIGVEDKGGPHVPYPPIRRDSERETNHGYVRLKGNLNRVETIPELKGWPDYAQLVRKVNGDDSVIESVGCAVGIWPSDLAATKYRVGAYLDILFSDSARAQSAEECLRAAAMLMASLEQCGDWWTTAEIGMQSIYLPGGIAALGLVLRFSAYGQTEQEARLNFAIAAEHVAAAIPHL